MPRAPARLELRQQLAHQRLLDHGVHRDPALVGELRDRRRAERGQLREHLLERLARHVHHQADAVDRGDRAADQRRRVSARWHLIDTWAYSAYGPMLGVILPVGLAETQDLDILQVEVALEEPATDLLGALREVNPTFEPSFSRTNDGPPYAFHNADAYRVEFLTAQSRKAQRDPVRIPGAGIGALPMPFLEYLRDATVDAVLLLSLRRLVEGAETRTLRASQIDRRAKAKRRRDAREEAEGPRPGAVAAECADEERPGEVRAALRLAAEGARLAPRCDSCNSPFGRADTSLSERALGGNSGSALCRVTDV